MDKAFFGFLVIGGIFFYVITNFVGNLQKEDALQSDDYKQQHLYDKYRSKDSIGQETLNLLNADVKTQTEAWKHSGLRQEFLDLFPDFDNMKQFIEGRISGEPIKSKIIKKIDMIQDKYLSGSIQAEQAKADLGEL